MTDEEGLHRGEVMGRIQSAVSLGATDFHDILAVCDGADPHLVAACIAELGIVVAASTRSASPAPAQRGPVLRLPAADPFRSQWWFAAETVELICGRVLSRMAVGTGRVLCLGAPTIGHALLARKVDAVVLDIDVDVVAALNAGTTTPAAHAYDAADVLPEDLHGAFTVAVLDPPWYGPAARAFLRRALAGLVAGGELLMSLPPRLTGPGSERFRAELIDELLKDGNELLGLERQIVRYVVPRFEEAALAGASGFRGMPWRRADLLHVRRGTSAAAVVPPLEQVAVAIFSRSPHEFRVFLRSQQSADPGVVLEPPLQAYSQNISTRAHAGDVPDIWTTEKVGARIGNLPLVRAVLEVWQDPAVRTRDEAIERLKLEHPGIARHAVEEFDRHLHLWSRFASQKPLRTDEEIERAKRASLTGWAAEASPREHAEGGDTFRIAYQRDRDRVLWSGSFRRLAHKTQLFPAEHDEQTRQRLTHSIEVMQLASTIGASFGLDRDLIEAGALAHDIGHTPFGHAGEHALDQLFNQILSTLGGFNHYEHGVDVIRWLEGPYSVSRATAFHGLNLTPEVAECILKHTFCHSGPGASTEHLLLSGKHGDFVKPGYCHLEGQAVRIADKISYLVSDLEDGLRLGALSLDALLGCHFFHRAPLYFKLDSRVTLYESFLAQRGSILKILMEDVLVATNKRLARSGAEDVRTAGYYLVDHSDEMRLDVGEIWTRLQKATLHQDRRVKLANLRATKIVSDLTILLAASPGLVDSSFAAEHSRLSGTPYLAHYRKAGTKVRLPAELLDFLPLERLIDFKRVPGRPLEVAVEHLVQAKDFVAALTDSRARALYADLLGN